MYYQRYHLAVINSPVLRLITQNKKLLEFSQKEDAEEFAMWNGLNDRTVVHLADENTYWDYKRMDIEVFKSYKYNSHCEMFTK